MASTPDILLTKRAITTGAIISKKSPFVLSQWKDSLALLEHLTHYTSDLLLVIAASTDEQVHFKQAFVAQISEAFRISEFATQAHFTEQELASAIAACFGITLTGTDSTFSFENRIEELVIRLSAVEKTAVLFVSNAQLWPRESLTLLCRVHKLSSQKLRIVLLATPQISENLDIHASERVAQTPIHVLTLEAGHQKLQTRVSFYSSMRKFIKKLLQAVILIRTRQGGFVMQKQFIKKHPVRITLSLTFIIMAAMLFFIPKMNLFGTKTAGAVRASATDSGVPENIRESSLAILPMANNEGLLESTGVGLGGMRPDDVIEEYTLEDSAAVTPENPAAAEGSAVESNAAQAVGEDDQDAAYIPQETLKNNAAPLVPKTKKVTVTAPVVSSNTNNVMPEKILVVEKTTVESLVLPPNFSNIEQKILAQAASHFTLQVAGGTNIKALQQLKQEIGLATQGVILHTLRDGHDWYILLQGEYKDQNEAVAAAKQLPAKIQALKPWARQLGSIQENIRQGQMHHQG